MPGRKGKKKIQRPVEFFFWLPERPPPQSLLSLKQFEKMSSKITYCCIFSVDNKTQYRTPGYSSQDVPVLLLCIKSKLFFSFIFILFLWRVLHSGEKKERKGLYSDLLPQKCHPAEHISSSGRRITVVAYFYIIKKTPVTGFLSTLVTVRHTKTMLM